MASRNGMANLITRWRRMVNDGDTSTWDDDAAEDFLDQHRIDFYQEDLEVKVVEVSGTARYFDYISKWNNLEEANSGTAAWRVYDSTGTEVGTANYTADYIRGKIRFNTDQGGTAYLLDGRSYDLHGAAADAWREIAGSVASYYSFGADGARYSRSHWFDHCMKMAAHHDALSRPIQVDLFRSDTR